MLKVLKVEADIDGVAVPFVDVVYIFFASQSSYKRSLWKHSSICRRPWFSCEWLVPFYSGQRRSCRRWLPALLSWRNPREPWLRKIEVWGGLQSKYCHWFLFHSSKKSAATYYSYMSKVLRSSPLEAKKPKNYQPAVQRRLVFWRFWSTSGFRKSTPLEPIPIRVAEEGWAMPSRAAWRRRSRQRWWRAALETGPETVK